MRRLMMTTFFPFFRITKIQKFQGKRYVGINKGLRSQRRIYYVKAMLCIWPPEQISIFEIFTKLYRLKFSISCNCTQDEIYNIQYRYKIQSWKKISVCYVLLVKRKTIGQGRKLIFVCTFQQKNYDSVKEAPAYWQSFLDSLHSWKGGTKTLYINVL